MTIAASSEQLRHIVQTAGLAPSVHNTQPWRFVERSGGLELRADTSRRLAVLDPDGRQLHLSCGAALLHARVAARALGLDVHVALLTDPDDPERLADLRITEGEEPGEDELRLAVATLHRHTFRGAFDDLALPTGLVATLQLEAEAEHAFLHAVTRSDDLIELEVMLSQADAGQERSSAYRDELAHWVRADTTTPDGIPSGQDRSPGSALRQRDYTFTHPDVTDGSAPRVDHPVVLVLLTAHDDARSWLHAGQALAAVLLRAADQGAQAQPLGQVTDALADRIRLGRVLGLVGSPQLVLRVGATRQGTATPRRDVRDVMGAMAG